MTAAVRNYRISVFAGVTAGILAMGNPSYAAGIDEPASGNGPETQAISPEQDASMSRLDAALEALQQSRRAFIGESQDRAGTEIPAARTQAAQVLTYLQDRFARFQSPDGNGQKFAETARKIREAKLVLSNDAATPETAVAALRSVEQSIQDLRESGALRERADRADPSRHDETQTGATVIERNIDEMLPSERFPESDKLATPVLGDDEKSSGKEPDPYQFEGRIIHGMNGENYGEVERIVRRHGKVQSAVIEFGEILGIGGKRVEVPIGKITERNGNLVLQMSDAEIERLPETAR